MSTKYRILLAHRTHIANEKAKIRYSCLILDIRKYYYESKMKSTMNMKSHFYWCIWDLWHQQCNMLNCAISLMIYWAFRQSQTNGRPIRAGISLSSRICEMLMKSYLRAANGIVFEIVFDPSLQLDRPAFHGSFVSYSSHISGHWSFIVHSHKSFATARISLACCYRSICCRPCYTRLVQMLANNER